MKDPGIREAYKFYLHITAMLILLILQFKTLHTPTQMFELVKGFISGNQYFVTLFPASHRQSRSTYVNVTAFVTACLLYVAQVKRATISVIPTSHSASRQELVNNC